MAAVYVDRRAFVSAFLSANPGCQFPGCAASSRDVHEVIRRSHGSALYPGQPNKRATGYLALCRDHHDWTTTHPLEARALGLDER